MTSAKKRVISAQEWRSASASAVEDQDARADAGVEGLADVQEPVASK